MHNFTVRETHERVHYSNRYPQWERVSDDETTVRCRSPSVGLATELAVMLPMATHALGEVRLAYAGYGKGRVPGTPNLPASDVSTTQSSLTLGLGFGW